MDPAVYIWARVTDYWVGINGTREEDPPGGCGQGTLRRYDIKTLKKGGELTGDIVSEVGRRIATSAPQVAFLDSTFLNKVAPIEGMGTKCRPQYWASIISDDTGSQIGTAKKVVIAPHYVPGHWCCATADLDSGRLVYYDPFYGPNRTGALDALGAFADQVSSEQGAERAIGATAFCEIGTKVALAAR